MGHYEDKKQRLADHFKGTGGEVRLEKDTSNLFRDRSNQPGSGLNVRAFNEVLEVDADESWLETEGMTPYATLVDATLAKGVMPCVVPQLRSITIGGAVSGVGIESTSFRYGLVHETILEMDVLTGTGEVVTCTPDNEFKDLFYGLPNSYGTLGYVLRIKAKAIPVKPYVRITHIHHSDLDAYFGQLNDLIQDPRIDFLDGTMFEPGQYYWTLGHLVDEAPYTSDYTFENVYYKSIRTREEDYLSIHDYLWRWDTDWFWCSKNVGAQNPVLRRIMGRKRLNSTFYTRVMRWNAKWGLMRALNRVTGTHTESVIQDIDIPLRNCAQYYRFFDGDIGIRPVWTCPITVYDPAADYPLYPIDADTTHVNFGHWDVVRGKTPRPEGYFNRLVEETTRDLGGIKSLYSDSYFEQDAFWQIYNHSVYQTLKRKYDPNSRFKDLYAKTVQRQ